MQDVLWIGKAFFLQNGHAYRGFNDRARALWFFFAVRRGAARALFLLQYSTAPHSPEPLGTAGDDGGLAVEPKWGRRRADHDGLQTVPVVRKRR